MCSDLKHALMTEHSSFGKGRFFERCAKDLFGEYDLDLEDTD